MSRHRDIRNMDYSDDYDGYDDVYGHSMDDDYYISPSHRQFLYNRENSREQQEDIAEEDEGEITQMENELSDLQKAKLESCLDHINSTLNSSNFSRTEIVKCILENNFDTERSLNALLEVPKAQVSKVPDKKDKVILPAPVIVPSEGDSAEKVIAASGKTTNVTKGFDISGRLNVTPRSQSPASGRGTPVIMQTGEPMEDTKLVKTREKIDVENLYKKERGLSKDHLYMIVIGHVDAGKSTLMGHLLCSLGQVNQRTMHKYEQESKKLGKQSFMYAWVLDETGEERSRGITMDVGRFQFETATKLVTLLDAPGHKDFIPNMISGAGQADVALMVVDATRGEFETGFDFGGQTREHALLVRSLGLTQLAVVINKLDTVSWSKERFDDIVSKLRAFLKQAGFRENDVTFVPCSGLTGQNLTQKPTENELITWYDGPCLLDVIDSFRSPVRPITKPLRLAINDVFKGTGSGFCVSGRVSTGYLSAGDRVLVCPNRESATVKSLLIEDTPQSVVFAGDEAIVTLSGIEMQNISVGNIICDPTCPVPVSNKFEARIVVFNTVRPITKGFSVVLHHQSLVEQAVVTKLISQINKNTGEIIKKHPRFLGNNTSALVEIQALRPIGIELYSECKELGRVMLRIGGVTVAAGLVTKIIL